VEQRQRGVFVALRGVGKFSPLPIRLS